MIRITIDICKENTTVITECFDNEKPAQVEAETANHPFKILVEEKTCTRCNKKFSPASNAQKYCSDKCKKPIKKPRKIKGKEQIVIKKTSEFGEKICVACGNKFMPKSNRQLRCSVACGMKPKVIVKPLELPEKPKEKLPNKEIINKGITEVFNITEEDILKSKDHPYKS